MNEIEFAPDGVLVNNLKELSVSRSVIEERRICELAELAESAAELIITMLDGGFGIYEAFSLISGGIDKDFSPIHTSCMEENRDALLSFIRSADAHDKALLARLIGETLEARGKRLAENDFFERVSVNELVSFVKNPLSLEAYDVFSQDMKEPRLTYSKDMKETASKLKSAEAGYAILPLEERGGARLMAVAELILREDLKINSVIPVFGEYGSADMKYALLSLHVSVPEIIEGDDRYLEIRIKAGDRNILAELLTVASHLDTEIYRVNTVSYTLSDDSNTYYSLVFKRESGDFTNLLTYLTIYAPDYTPVGIYKNLE